MLIKILIVTLLTVILTSLFSALFFLVKDKQASARTAKALTWRIGLSITLFVLLLIGYGLGWVGHPL